MLLLLATVFTTTAHAKTDDAVNDCLGAAQQALTATNGAKASCDVGAADCTRKAQAALQITTKAAQVCGQAQAQLGGRKLRGTTATAKTLDAVTDCLGAARQALDATNKAKASCDVGAADCTGKAQTALQITTHAAQVCGQAQAQLGGRKLMGADAADWVGPVAYTRCLYLCAAKAIDQLKSYDCNAKCVADPLAFGG